MRRFVLRAGVLAGGIAAVGVAARPWTQGPAQQAEAPTRATYAPPGFEVQRVYDIPLQTQGSWVALAVGPDGSLYASDQNAAGVYRIRVTGDIDTPRAQVTKVPLDSTASRFQGMVWAFNSLYGNKNAPGDASGLFRMRDTNNDGELDSTEKLPVGIIGSGEHGNHDVLVTEDGRGLYLINGNDSRFTRKMDTTTIVEPWLEDFVTPRQADARGHSRGNPLPGSTTVRVNPDGTGSKLLSMAYRNTYSAALNMHGELIGYDSDLEWDMGAPWYRPTRITHITSGSDFGWRNGTGKLPAWTEGTLPGIADIGPGSPTGVISGIGAKFPAKYQRAIYALDWTYSTVFAVHMTPKGSSYTAEVEEFVFGDPFQVTDAAIGADGHMYVLTGGRGGQGHLWRVVYKGNESTARAQPLDTRTGASARSLRRSLERFHGRRDPRAVAAAWPHLSSTDVFLRNAARVAIEHQPVASWRQRALTESNPMARVTALLALSRADSTQDGATALNSLLQLNFANMNAEGQLAALRTLGVMLVRLGPPTDAERQRVIAKLQPMLPSADRRVNIELVRDLVLVRDPGVTAKAIALMTASRAEAPNFWGRARMQRSARYGAIPLAMLDAPQNEEGLWYAWILRSHREGWTPDLARQYFTFINAQQQLRGGASYAGHMLDMEAEALRNMPAAVRVAVADLTGRTF
ncbi:MAG: cytochrome C, partial [Gemmatimonadetes bacterium]|nr:cytochrome C [Gemmatimonadota bacterium]